MGKKARRPLKVLHAPLNFANQAYVLSQALRARGVDSHLLRYQWEGNTASRFYQEEDRVAEISRIDWFGDLLRNVQNITAEGFDIVHFWNRTLLWRRPHDVFNAMDLPFIRLAGTRLAYRFTGYELRRKSLELAINPFTPYRYGYQSAFSEDDQKRYLDYLACYVDAFVVQDPEMQSYCPQASIIPRALALEQFPVREPAPNKRPLVVHAPSRRALKGSEFVIKAVDALKEEGLDFDFLVIEDMPNAEALEHYRRADIIIDQLLVGWYGVLSMEAMAMGKTVIVYIRDDLKSYFGSDMPLVIANPETITTALRQTIKDEELRREIAHRARAFVEEVHDSRVVARSAAKLYKKILKARAPQMVPDFTYQLGNSVNFVKTLNAAARTENLQRKFEELERTYDPLKTAHEVAESEARKVAVLVEQLALLRDKAERYDQVERELPALRHDARRYEELKPELPSLRYKSQRYDELKDVALVWRAKADRLDRFAAKRWVKFVLPLLGLPLAFKFKRSQPATRKTRTGGRDRLPAATGDTGGEAGEGDPVIGTLPGLKQPEAPSLPIVPQPVSKEILAQGNGAAKQCSVIAEVRAILRIARVPKPTPPREAGPAAKQGVTALPAIGQPVRSPFPDKGVVCIVSRKRINNITRAPRMAKALVDAGYEVVVVSLARPVPQLQEMCPQVEYLEVTPSSFVRDLTIRCQKFRRKRENYQAKREAEYQAAMARGGLRAFARQLGRAVKVPFQWAAGLLWRLFIIAPSALLLRKPSQRFAQRWGELAFHDAVGIAREFAIVQNQRWSTHALADEADEATRGHRFDIVQAYDNYALVAAARLATRDGAKLIYDAVELSRMGLDLNFVERIRERAERREEARIIRKSDAVVTVSDGLADQYARRYRRPRPVVVRNCRYFWVHEVDRRLRADAGVGPEVRLLVWCGSLYPQHGIEFIIKALPHLAPNIHAAIIGFFQPFWKSYVQEELPALVASLGVADRVHFLPEREPNDIVPYISGADIGVVPGSRQHANFFFGMPNKFLEMVMARLPIAVSQVGNMVDLLNKYEMGKVFDEHDPAKIAAVVEAMLEPSTYARLKANVMKAAEILNWEKESLPYVELVRSLMPPQVRMAAAAGSCETAAGQKLVGRQAPLPAEGAAKKAMPTRAAFARLRAAKGAKIIEENTKLHTTNEQLKVSYFQAAEANKKLRDAIDNSRAISQFYRDSTSVNHYLRFARYCYERAGDIKAVAYVAHGVEALPAADAVAKAVGGRVYCDVIEMPSFAQRSVTYDLHPTSHSLLDHAFDGYLRAAAGLSTVGWALGDQIQHYGPRVTVIPNYRNRERLQRSTQIREKCGLGSEGRLLLASSTISSGLEPVVEALKLLPDKVHLATLGNFFRDYRERIQAVVVRLDVEDRVHFFDPVPYDQFATVASGANIGLIAVDPSLMHWQISLPNRLFDCIAAGLPIVTPDVPDIARIVEGRKIGVTLPKSDARSWADAIASALNDEEALRANVLAVSEELVWESLGDKLHAAYDHAATVTIIGFTDLIGHQRTIRMAETLVRRGVPVTICCPHEGPVPPDEMPGVRIVLTPRPLAILPATNAPSAPVSKPNGAAAVEPVSEVLAAKANGAAAPANGVPVLTLSVSEPLQIPSRTEQASLERLKKEVIELRYKARRYDEVKGELPAWQAKAARYDRLKGKGGRGLLVSLRRSLQLTAGDGNGKSTKRGSTPS